MITKENLKHQIDIELSKEIYQQALVDAPPTELTKLLLYLDLTDSVEVSRFVEKIAVMVSEANLWHTSLVEVLAVFIWQDDPKNLYAALLKYLYTKNFHKFSCIFGQKSKLQDLALYHLKSDLTPSNIRSMTPSQLYAFFTLAYCVGIESFRQLLDQISPVTSTDGVVDPSSRQVSTKTFDQPGFDAISQKTATHNRDLNRTGKALKIAICISGQLRGYKHFPSSLKRMNLDNHDCQVFVSTWEMVGGRFPHLDQAHRIFSKRFATNFRDVVLTLGEASFRTRYPTLEQLVVNPSRVNFDQLSSFYNTEHIDLQDDEVEAFKSFSSITKMHYKLGRCLQLVLKQTSEFDLIIRMRPDLQFVEPVNVNWNELYLDSLHRRIIYADYDPYISARVINWQIGEVLPLMMGDLFAVGALEPMKIYMDTFNENIRLIDLNVPGLPKGFMPHTTLSRILMYHNIGVETFPQASITDKNLIEFSILNDVQIGEALQKDLEGRPSDQFDKHLLAALD